MNNQLKQYTGTKTVKARPMTMGEAYECKLLKEGIRPSECETDKAGYLVEYEDGYQSWSPKDVFDAAYKLSETFLDRLMNEYEEICDRGEKYGDFIESDNFEKLGYTARILLVAQDMIMHDHPQHAVASPSRQGYPDVPRKSSHRLRKPDVDNPSRPQCRLMAPHLRRHLRRRLGIGSPAH